MHFIKLKCENRDYKGTVDFWDRYCFWYERWINNNSFHRQVLEIIRDDIHPNDTVLDIGGGSGVLALPLSPITQKVTVIEPSSEMIKTLRKNLLKFQVDNINYIQQRWEDVNEKELPNYDIGILCNSIYWSDNLSLFLDRAADVCTRQLIVIVKIPNRRFQVSDLYQKLSIPEPKASKSFWDLLSYLKQRNYHYKVAVQESPSYFVYSDFDEVVDHWSILLNIEKKQLNQNLNLLLPYLKYEQGKYFYYDKNLTGICTIQIF